jgi:hypothetical protein
MRRYAISGLALTVLVVGGCSSAPTRVGLDPDVEYVEPVARVVYASPTAPATTTVVAPATTTVVQIPAETTTISAPATTVVPVTGATVVPAPGTVVVPAPGTTTVVPPRARS